MAESEKTSRRGWLASVLMGAGLVASYGVFAFQGFLFLLPKRTQAKTRNIFAGRVSQFAVGGVKGFSDLEGNEILVRRKSEGEFEAFSSTCPHLGCKVHWQEEEQQYFCPCHRGVFDSDGNAVSGPPADGGQRLASIPIEVDEAAGVVYIQVKDPGRRSA
ncbi:MAG: Rieske (2Fe-2S) protein [Acidobacteriota bacterium]|nr:MAG: Rieske (2Fe-2S) protein [Acidobacteriota bacterium]